MGSRARNFMIHKYIQRTKLPQCRGRARNADPGALRAGHVGHRLAAPNRTILGCRPAIDRFGRIFRPKRTIILRESVRGSFGVNNSSQVIEHRTTCVDCAVGGWAWRRNADGRRGIGRHRPAQLGVQRGGRDAARQPSRPGGGAPVGSRWLCRPVATWLPCAPRRPMPTFPPHHPPQLRGRIPRRTGANPTPRALWSPSPKRPSSEPTRLSAFGPRDREG